MQVFIEEPWLSKLREHCLVKPGSYEDYPWDQLAFKVAPSGKMFCSCSGAYPSITVKSTLDKQSALIQHPSIEVAAYVGRHGWVTVNIQSDDEFELACDLIDESYALVAPKRKAKGSP